MCLLTQVLRVPRSCPLVDEEFPDSDQDFLSTESVESLSLTLERIHDVHGSDRFTTGVFSVGDRIPNNILEENFQDTTSLFVNETRNTLHTATSGKTADCGLGDALNIVAKDLSVTLRASFSETFTSFTAARHD
ncbi:hypothetical protein ACHAXS_002827 [Conticribra weissflogii]